MKSVLIVLCLVSLVLTAGCALVAKSDASAEISAYGVQAQGIKTLADANNLDANSAKYYVNGPATILAKWHTEATANPFAYMLDPNKRILCNAETYTALDNDGTQATAWTKLPFSNVGYIQVAKDQARQIIAIDDARQGKAVK